ncbi:hypothetical protein AUR64_12020 [Haloprofundus marisrubri]|uniref:DUF6199 domain-containing protein n=1 Tax=Haloprofundus marisrubri TaxID=1514971 RepID=A0A0W1RA22_9EURY|nr:hypothetical protein [Haloprofundus marisrubri]KTG10296.1 hypothetical protein AUR64_12020 [Haloprofundus marisrubri]
MSQPTRSTALQFSFGFGFIRLFGLLFAAVALLFVFKPRAMTQNRIRTNDGTSATIEPTDTQLLAVRIVAGFMALFGLHFTFGFGFDPSF